jgi:outer membrane protein assembly factor BamB
MQRAILVLGLLPCVPLLADDWAEWRGPNRDGAWNETGILESFPSAGLKVRWRAPVGAGFSSPVVARGHVYVTDSELVRPMARERIHAFEETTGKPAWSHAHELGYPDWAFDDKSPLGPSATPIVADGRVYSLGALGHLTCCEAVKGGVLWRRDLAREHPAKELQCRASPLIEGDLLIVFVGAKPAASVIALDKGTGKDVWKALDEPATPSSPIIITSGGKRQLIVWTEESVTSLDPLTGNVHWRQRIQSTAEYVVSTPVFHEDRLLLGGLMLKLDPEKGSVSVLWPEKRTVVRRILSNTSTPLLRGDCVFSARSSGELICLEASTGNQLWESDKVTEIRNGASIHITPNGDGDSAFLYNERGELIRARLSREGYKEVSRASLIRPTYPFGGRNCAWSPPAFANRHVFVRSDQDLVCVSLAAQP